MKALEILKEGLVFMNQAIKVNPNSVKELQSEIDRYVEAIDELETKIREDEKFCDNCYHIGDYDYCEYCIRGAGNNKDYWDKR